MAPTAHSRATRSDPSHPLDPPHPLQHSVLDATSGKRLARAHTLASDRLSAHHPDVTPATFNSPRSGRRA